MNTLEQRRISDCCYSHLVEDTDTQDKIWLLCDGCKDKSDCLRIRTFAQDWLNRQASYQITNEDRKRIKEKALERAKV